MRSCFQTAPVDLAFYPCRLKGMEPARPPLTRGLLHATDFEEGPEGSGQIFLSMSARALKFLNRWMAEHLPNVSTEDPGAIADLVVELLATAGRQGIAPQEIYEEVDSVFHLLKEAMQRRGGGLAD